MMVWVGRKRFWLGFVFSFVQFSFFLCSPVVSTMGVFCLMGGWIDGGNCRLGVGEINRACGQHVVDVNEMVGYGVADLQQVEEWFDVADLGICGRQGGLGLMGGGQVGLSCFQNGKQSGIWCGKLDILVVFVFSHVHEVVVDACQSHSYPPSSPSNIKNGCTYTQYRTARLNGLKMARTVAGCHKFLKKADNGVYIDQKWRSLVYMTYIIGRYA